MWIIVAISGYFLLAVASTVDKYLLAGPIPSPKVYAFFIGMLGAVVFLLIPFGFIGIPSFGIIALAFLAGIIRVLALTALFSGLQKFEVSRIIPALGGMAPLCTVVLLFVILGETESISRENFPALLLLVAGSVGISLEKKAFVTAQSLLYAGVAAFLFSVFFVLSKIVYDSDIQGADPFLTGLVWIAVGSVTTSLVFLAFREVRKAAQEIFGRKNSQKIRMSKKIAGLFVGNQAVGGVAIFLQSFAVGLVPIGLLPFVSALEGVNHFFIFVMTVILSLYFPRVLKEDISKRVIAQKIVAILSIAAGLVILAV
jgi:hypothetical protein